MNIRHHELYIDDEDPFLSCKLDRRKYAEILTEIVRNYPDGFVLAINNRWGTGKSTFVKMWRQHLSNEGFKSVYFNVWENDFDKDPLTALVAEFKSLIGKNNQKIYNGVLKKGSAIAKAVLPNVAKNISKGLVDIELIAAVVENLSKEVSESFDTNVNDYLKKKDSIKGFKDTLADFVDKTEGEKPIVFIIDELDRCRPDYAVEVLEQLKHFFSVPGIVFALSIDKNQLGAAVKGFYGSEQIDANEYLRRFIDLEFSIPAPSVNQYCSYLYEYYGFDDFFRSSVRQKHKSLEGDGETFLRISSILCEGANLTLRQIEKIFGRVRLVLSSFKSNHYVLPQCLFVLAFWATIEPEFFALVSEGKVHSQKLCDGFGKLFSVRDSSVLNFLSLTEAWLIVIYANEFGEPHNQLVFKDGNGEYQTHLIPNLPGISSENLAKAVGYVRADYDRHSIKLSHLTSRLSLTEPLAFTD